MQANVDHSYELAGPKVPELSQHVGKRVEVTGTVIESSRPSADSAHPSAPRGRMTVASFRELGGACPLG